MGIVEEATGGCMPRQVKARDSSLRSEGLVLKCSLQLFSVSRRENGQNILQTLPDLAKVGGRVGGERQGRLLLVALTLIAQVLASARNGVSLFIEVLLVA